MDFRWECYLDLAHALAPDAHPFQPVKVAAPLQKLSDEARFRCAISRAYYAAMSGCREHIRHYAPAFPLPSDAREHGDVRRFFAESTDPEEQSIGRHLKKLAEWRRQADYANHLPQLNWKQTASGALELAEKVCQKVPQP